MISAQFRLRAVEKCVAKDDCGLSGEGSSRFREAIRLNSLPIAALGIALVLAFTSTGGAQTDDPSFDEAALRRNARRTLKDDVTPFVKKYCISCHGGYAQAGVNLQSAIDSPESATSVLHWKKAVANVKVHDMPPEDAGDIPTDEERSQFIEWIGTLKYLAERDPGPFVIRRLSKVEYANTLHDLYDVSPSIADNLPEEVVGEGYLNSVSPLQTELFLEIANEVIDQVVAPAGQPPTALQQRLFGDTPPEGADLGEAARGVARDLARQAYRRPPTEAELDFLVGIYELGRENDLDYTASLALMWKAVLISPQFLFITPVTDVEFEAKIVPLDNYQLASRLSYLLWSAPPDAELSELADRGEKNIEGLTLRERTELHRTETTCATCHRVLDPLGCGLENFDAIGRWRDKDDVGVAIDSAGQLPSGESFSTPADLKRLVAEREADLARNLTERLMAFALGRQLQNYDEVVIDRVMATIAQDGYRFQTLITEVITSDLFTYRRVR